MIIQYLIELMLNLWQKVRLDPVKEEVVFPRFVHLVHLFVKVVVNSGDGFHFAC